MAAKTSEASLRVTAKNLASKDLKSVSTDLDNIAESQKKNATASGLASKALRQLTEEQRALATVAGELQRRGGIIGNLAEQKAKLDALKPKIVGARLELERLQNVKARGGFGTENIDKQIVRTRKGIADMGREIKSTAAKFDRAAEAGAKVGISLKNSDEQLAQINAEAARTEQLMVSAAGAVERYNGALLESKAALNAQEAAQKEITAEAARRNVLEGVAATRRRREAADELAQLREQQRIRDELTRRFNAKPLTPQAAPTVLGPGGDLAAQGIAREVAFRERLVNVLRRQKDGGDKLLASDGKLAAATNKVTASLDRNARSLDRNNRLGGVFADTGRKSLSVYQRLRGQLLSTAAAYVGLYQAVSLVTSAITVQQERRRIEIQLKLANQGDTAAAARDIQFLREQADRLGLVYEGLAKNFANYKIAGQAVGASNKTIRESFVEATEVVTGLGLSADDAEGVFRAFVQILGKARVQAEELRGQLGDRLPGAVAAFANSLIASGKIKAFSDLDSYLKKGKAGVQDFFNFLKAYSEKTKGAVDEQSRTLFANFNRLKNTYRDFLVEFSKGSATPQLARVVDELTKKLKGADGANLARDLGVAFTGVAKAMLFVIENFDKLITFVKLFLALQVVKALVGISSGFLNMGFKAYQAAKAVVAFTAATNAARIAGTGLTGGMRVLLALLGPVGGALALAAVFVYKFIDAERAAQKQTEDMIKGMQALRAASGEQLHAVTLSAAQSAKGVLEQIHEVSDKLKEAKRLRDNAFLGSVGDKLDEVSDVYRKEKESVAGLEAQLAHLKQTHQGYVDTAVRGSKLYIKFKQEEIAAAKAAAAEQDNFVTGSSSPSGEGGAKAAAAAEAARLLIERRKDMEDKAAKAILEIDKALADARQTNAIASQDTIEANYQQQLAEIDADIKKRRIDLEAIKNDALNMKGGTADPKAAADAQVALDKLPLLQEELNKKAEIEKVTAGIALQESKINQLVAERDAKIEAVNALVEAGIKSEVEGRKEILDIQAAASGAITKGVTDLIATLEALKASNPNLAEALHVDELIAKLEVTKTKAGELQTQVQLIGKNLGGQFAGGVASAFGTFIKGLTGGIEGVHGFAEAFKNAKNSFLDFLADFLVGIGQAILQAILLKAIMNAINHTSGGYVDAAVGALGGSTGHTGGVVGATSIGQGNPIRQVSAAVFAGAQRFHTGGLPGLKKGEVAAILKQGEEVVTRDDPRNVLNGGAAGGGQPKVDLAIHNHIDSGSMVKAGLNTRVGRKELFNVIQADKENFKRLLT
jgi:tape measure domain-containing protein